MPCISSGTPAPVAAEPAYTGCSSPAAVCVATAAAQPPGRAAAPLDVRREEGVVVLGEHLRLAVAEPEIVGAGTP